MDVVVTGKWGLALIRTDSILHYCESEKPHSKFTKKVIQTPLCILWVAYLGEIHFTWPQVKCLREISSCPDATGAWCKFTQSLQLPHNTILYSVTICYGGGQMGKPCLHSAKMPWLSDSSQTQKWNKSIVASLMVKTKPTTQHDNDHRSTQALGLPPESPLQINVD